MAGPIISIPGGSVVESTSFRPDLVFRVTLSEPSNTEVTVQSHTVQNTADAWTDYFPPNFGDVRTLTVPAGDTAATFVVDAESDDTNIEPEENFAIRLINPEGAMFAGNAPELRANGTILDDDGSGNKLALLVLDDLVVEGGGGLPVISVANGSFTEESSSPGGSSSMGCCRSRPTPTSA